MKTMSKLILVPCTTTEREYYPDGSWRDVSLNMWVPEDTDLIAHAEYWRDKNSEIFHRFMAFALQRKKDLAWEKENNNG